MSSAFALQEPSFVASLPWPIDRSNGKYSVGEVHGKLAGAKKRKRSELAVGIDGESVNLYDISSPKLITSYALPPQSSFTCPPYSLRLRASKGHTERKTYVSTMNIQPEITLFHDVMGGYASADSKAVTCKVEGSLKPIIYMGSVMSQVSSITETTFDLFVMKEDGEAQCLDGNSLEVLWTSSSAVLQPNTEETEGVHVEYVQLTNVHAARQSILKERQDLPALFSEEVSENGYNPDILVVITKVYKEGHGLIRTIHTLNLPGRFKTTKQSLESLLSANLPHQNKKSQESASFHLHIPSGTLQQLSAGVLTTYDFNSTLPKRRSQFTTLGAKTFLQLSSASVIVSSEESIDVYNPTFQSILASLYLDTPDSSDSRKRKRNSSVSGSTSTTCNLVAYFSKLGLAIALRGNNLISIQVDTHNHGRSKLQTGGRLVDSIGCSVRRRPRMVRAREEPEALQMQTLESYLPGSADNASADFAEQSKESDKMADAEDSVAFDTFMAQKIGVTWLDEEKSKVSTINSHKEHEKKSHSKIYEEKLESANMVDRRWVLYALSKIFTWARLDTGVHGLAVAFYPPNLFFWLIQSGYMTRANIQSALRDEIHASPTEQIIQAGQLIDTIIEIDPEMGLLLALLSNNYLDAAELLHIVRKLLASLELIGDNSKTAQELLTNGNISDDTFTIDEELEQLEAQVEEALQFAEYQLGPGSGIRGQALSIALSKLYTCPGPMVVRALQTELSSQEILALIYILRSELARGSWTSRYLDVGYLDSNEESDDAPGSTIVLISGLLNSCVDAIGAGGWLSGDTRLINSDSIATQELIMNLKLEVSAAVEGLDEARYLLGLTSEMVRYGDALQKINHGKTSDLDVEAGKKRKAQVQPPILLPSADQDMRTLPLGSKAEAAISRSRIGAGGEIQARTARDIGRLKSQRVGKYTQERIIL